MGNENESGKPTPGKWVTQYLENEIGEAVLGRVVVFEYSDTGEINGSTVVVPGMYLDDETTKADLHILAESKNLLEALECLLEDAPASGLLSVANARAVISRARGLPQ